MLAHLDSVNKKFKKFRREAFEKILAVSRLICVDFCNHLSCFAFSGKGLMQPAEETKVYNYSDLISELDQDNVKTIEVTKSKEVSNYGTATAVLDDGTKMTVNVPSVDVLMEEVSQMPAEGSDIQVVTPNAPSNMLSAILPSLIMMIVMVVLFVVHHGQNAGGGGKMPPSAEAKPK